MCFTIQCVSSFVDGEKCHAHVASSRRVGRAYSRGPPSPCCWVGRAYSRGPPIPLLFGGPREYARPTLLEYSTHPTSVGQTWEVISPGFLRCIAPPVIPSRRVGRAYSRGPPSPCCWVGRAYSRGPPIPLLLGGSSAL